jgi:hypothetical protein
MYKTLALAGKLFEEVAIRVSRYLRLLFHPTAEDPMNPVDREHPVIQEVRLLVEQLLDARALVAYLIERHEHLRAICLRSSDPRTRWAASEAGHTVYHARPIQPVSAEDLGNAVSANDPPQAVLRRAGPPPRARLD